MSLFCFELCLNVQGKEIHHLPSYKTAYVWQSPFCAEKRPHIHMHVDPNMLKFGR